MRVKKLLRICEPLSIHFGSSILAALLEPKMYLSRRDSEHDRGGDILGLDHFCVVHVEVLQHTQSGFLGFSIFLLPFFLLYAFRKTNKARTQILRWS